MESGLLPRLRWGKIHLVAQHAHHDKMISHRRSYVHACASRVERVWYPWGRVACCLYRVWRRRCAAPAVWNDYRVCALQRLPLAIRTSSSMLKLSVNMQYIQFVNSLNPGRHTLPVVPERSAEEPGQRYSRGRQSPNKAFNAFAIDPFTEINSEILAGLESHFEGTP